MPLADPTTCPGCGRPHAEDALACSLCGQLLRRASPLSAPTPAETQTASTAESTWSAPEPSAEELRRLRIEPWFFLGLGALTAPVFALTPMVGFMGWFLASLVHEMGHSATAWLCGMPSVPAISPAGHAAAVHGDQNLFLVVMLVAFVATTLWRVLEGRTRVVVLTALGVLYPILAFTPVRELAFLLSGHGGELAFATLALWKTLDGGFTDSHTERALYGTVGWFLFGKNVLLCFGLMTSAGSRAHYASNGSFGLTNDYLRVAEDHLGTSLELVAGGMLLASLAVLPTALWLWRQSSRAREL